MIYKKRPYINENMITIMLGHLLIQEGIHFDTEYDPDRNYVGDVVKPKKPTRDKPCYCGSNKKYKNCCRAQDRLNGERGSRFDMVIVKNEMIVGIIEMKKRPDAIAEKQINRYEKYGVPVFLCAGENSIPKALEFCRKITATISHLYSKS